MKDSSYLAACVNSLRLLFNDNDLAFIKDLSFRYIAATAAYSKMVLSSSSDDVDICGKYDNEVIKSKDEAYHDLLLKKIRYFDEKTIYQKKTSFHLVLALGIKKPAQLKIPLVNKLKPLINPATGNVVGMMGVLEKLYLLNMPLFILKNSGQYYQYSIRSDQIKLTELQQITLFLLCNFLTAKEIKIVLDVLGIGRTVSNVNATITLLKAKFGVTTKEALLERALRMNCHINIPERIFPKIFYDFDEFEVNIL